LQKYEFILDRLFGLGLSSKSILQEKLDRSANGGQGRGWWSVKVPCVKRPDRLSGLSLFAGRVAERMPWLEAGVDRINAIAFPPPARHERLTFWRFCRRPPVASNTGPGFD